METSTIVIGALIALLILMALRRPSRSTEHIFVPIYVPVKEKIGCMPAVVVIAMFLLLAVLIRG